MQIRIMLDTEKDDCSGLRELLGKYVGVKVKHTRTRKKAGEIAGVRGMLDMIAAYRNADKLTTEEAAEILVYGKGIRSWLDDLRDKVKTAIENGEKVDGWKVVEGRKKRVFADNLKAIDALEKAGLTYDEIIQEYVTFSIPKLEEKFGVENVSKMMEGNIRFPQGDHVLVEETDKRVSIC